MNKIKAISLTAFIIISVVFVVFLYEKRQLKPQESEKLYVEQDKKNDIKLAENPKEPIINFKQRITKKPFGIYVSPLSSPVKPEHFKGFHTGVDIEYEDTNQEVPVYSVSDGHVVYSDKVSGYGGVLVLRQKINGKEYLVLYGHLNPSSLVSRGRSVTRGERIAILGQGFSPQTDYERKHLHFGIIASGKIDFRGYVQKKEELSNWIDPQSINFSNQ